MLVVLKQLSVVTITYGILKQTKCSQVLKQLSIMLQLPTVF